jgi:hypothetical protein
MVLDKGSAWNDRPPAGRAQQHGTRRQCASPSIKDWRDHATVSNWPGDVDPVWPSDFDGGFYEARREEDL